MLSVSVHFMVMHLLPLRSRVNRIYFVWRIWNEVSQLQSYWNMGSVISILGTKLWEGGEGENKGVFNCIASWKVSCIETLCQPSVFCKYYLRDLFSCFDFVFFCFGSRGLYFFFFIYIIIFFWWKVWTQESFQVEFDRPGERSPE